MKKILVLFALTILFTVLDNALVPFISIKGYYPSLLFCFIISYSIIDGSWYGLWIGIFCGILQDVYFFSGFGINMFSNMLTCVIAGIIGSNIFKEKALIPVVTCFGLSVFKGLLVYAILYVAQQYTYLDTVLFDSLYTMAAAIPMYRFVYRLSQKEYMQKKWKF